MGVRPVILRISQGVSASPKLGWLGTRHQKAWMTASSTDIVTCDIFIRSYAKDFEWLGYCLESIVRFWSGFRAVVVVVPESSRPLLRRLRLPSGAADLRFCPDYRDDYLGQQATKLSADAYTDADLICHVDSDCVFTRPTTTADFLVAGRPRIQIHPLSLLDRHYPWREPTRGFLGWEVDFDFMRHPPFVYPRWIYGELRSHSQRVHGIDLEAYVMSRPPRGFSEFNVLGAFAYQRHRDLFAWVDTSREPAVPPHCRWYWSWGGLDAVLRREIETLLGA
jgi:hypothetical protein